MEGCQAWQFREVITQTAVVDQRGKNLIGSLADLLTKTEQGPAPLPQPRAQTDPAGPAADGQELIKPRILELLREESIPMTAETIAQLGTTAKNVKPRLSELKKRNEITNENGLWRAA